jgi:hypothetical protein
MTAFHQCSRTVTTLAYQTVLELTTSKEISEMLCQALANISATCPNLLQECFAPEDVDQLKSLHLLEMKDYLVKIARNRVTSKELEGCAERSPKDIIPQRPATTPRGGYEETSDASAMRSIGETTRGPRIFHASTSRPVHVEVTKPPAPLQKPASDYDDYYKESEEEGAPDNPVVEDKAKEQPASSSPGPVYPLKKEAASIRGDDEGPWGSGEARTLTGGAAGRLGSPGGLLGLCCLLLWIFL